MMLRFCNIVFSLIFILLAGSEVEAQGVLFNFSYDRSTYLWQDSLWVNHDFSNNVSVLLQNQSNAMLIKKSLFVNSGDRWQKNANTNLVLTYNRQSDFSWGVTGYNNYSRLENRRVTMNQLGLHQDLAVTRNLEMSNVLSYSETSRYIGELNEKDPGVMQKFDMSYIGPFFNLGSLGVSYDHELNLLRRTPEKSFRLNLGFANNSTEKQISLNYSGNYQKNKFFSDLNSFDRVTTQNKYEHNGDLHLNFNLIRDLDLDLVSTYSYRRFEYREEAPEGSTRLLGRDNLTSTFYYKMAAEYPLLGISLLRAEYIYRASEEEFGDIFNGQDIDLGELRLSYYLNLTKNDSIFTSGTFSVTSYKGKNRENLFSDRDRAFRLGQLIYQHGFSEHLLLRMRGSYQYNHYVYISSVLSANNNHNEVYLVQPEIEWSPVPSLRISQSYVMHANYIYYDYEKYMDSQRNTLYRKADYLLKINYAFSPHLDIMLSYRYRYEDFGQLVYRDQWAQRISWDRKGHLPSIEVEWRPSPALIINPGYSYERKHSFDHLAGTEEGQIVLEEKELFKRERIFINIEYRPGAKSNIQFAYTRRVQKSLLFSDDNSDIVTLNIRRYF